MTFPYEKEAMNGEPMPKGLSLADQMAYQALSGIYLRYHLNGITREQGAEEKRKLALSYNVAKTKRETELGFSKRFSEIIAKIESAANVYAKDRTLENADRLYKALYGMEPSKKE